jgi:hypothetical protein
MNLFCLERFQEGSMIMRRGNTARIMFCALLSVHWMKHWKATESSSRAAETVELPGDLYFVDTTASLSSCLPVCLALPNLAVASDFPLQRIDYPFCHRFGQSCTKLSELAVRWLVYPLHPLSLPTYSLPPRTRLSLRQCLPPSLRPAFPPKSPRSSKIRSKRDD